MRTFFTAFFLLPLAATAQDLLSPWAYFSVQKGYEVREGERFTPHHEVVDYLHYVADHSDHVVLQPYGRTHEGRPLLLAVVGLPELLAQREQVALSNRQRAGLEEGTPQHDVVVTWLGFNIHGNEASGTEAALHTLHTLANTPSLLSDKQLVVIDPCLNPDGRDRYALGWAQRYQSLEDTDPNSWAHTEPWPGGRENHFLFDLNRDWAWLTQPESQARIAQLTHWMPQVCTDFHEMDHNSSYFFAPSARPQHPAIRQAQRSLELLFGQAYAETFDSEDWPYYTAENFDLIYPGYGDTYPIFNGSISFTFEQGGHGQASNVVKTDAGTVLSLADRLRHHSAVALATVKAAQRYHDQLQRSFAEHFKVPGSTSGAYLLATGGDTYKTEQLAALLASHKIDFGYVAQSQKMSGKRHGSGAQVSFEAAANDIVIPRAQPKHIFLEVLMEPAPELEDSLTYDITAWSLPHAYGVAAYALKNVPETTSEPTPAKATPPGGKVLAYGLPWSGFSAAQAVAKALEQGLVCRQAHAPLRLGDTDFPRGSVFVLQHENEGQLHHVAEAAGWVPLGTSKAQQGPDLGSDQLAVMKAPRVAVLVDEGINVADAGEAWFFMDQLLQYPYTLLSTATASASVLADYDVVVVPEGKWASGERGSLALQDYAAAGGRVVALAGAASAVAGSVLGWAAASPKSDQPANYAGSERTELSSDTPGAVYTMQLDPTHPLAYGMGPQTTVLVRSTKTLEPSPGAWEVGKLSRSPEAGFVGYRALPHLAGTPRWLHTTHGQGHVVLLQDNPLFRMFWRGTHLVMANAILGHLHD